MRLGQKEFSRREFLRLTGAGLSYLALESITFLISVEVAKELAIFHHIIRVPHLDPRWRNTFLIHFSDLHLSEPGFDFINPAVLAQYTQELKTYLQRKRVRPEKTFVIDTGDLVSRKTGSGEPTPIETVRESLVHLTSIPSAAKFFTPGNHEQYHPQRQRLLKIMAEAGYINLGVAEQNNFILDRPDWPFTFAGAPDFTTHETHWYRSDAAFQFLAELRNRQADKPVVLASHTSFFDSWEEGGLQNTAQNTLFLHGHTHGGQIAPNMPLQYLAGNYAVYGKLKQRSRYYRGMQEVGNGNIISVSPGLGHTVYQGPRSVIPGAVLYEIR